METGKYLTELNNEFLIVNEKPEDILAAQEYAKNLIDLGLPVIFDISHFCI